MFTIIKESSYRNSVKYKDLKTAVETARNNILARKEKEKEEEYSYLVDVINQTIHTCIHRELETLTTAIESNKIKHIRLDTSYQPYIDFLKTVQDADILVVRTRDEDCRVEFHILEKKLCIFY